VVLFLVAYAYRLSTAIQPGVSHDDAEYIVLAESFATGRPYRLVNFPDAPLESVWPPGYPLFFLTLPWRLLDGDPYLLRLANVAIAILVIVLGYLLLKQTIATELALGGVVLLALNPTFVGLATINMSDIAFTGMCIASLYALTRWQKTDSKTWYLFATLLLAVAILTRYQGIAVLIAVALYLVLQRKPRHAAVLVIGVCVLLLPFVLFVTQETGNDTSSFLAVQIASRSITSYAQNAALSFYSYWKAIPLVVVPLLGPSVEGFLASVQLAWLVPVLHSVLIAVILMGFLLLSLRQPLIGLAVGCYVLLIFLMTNHRGGQLVVFDEPRYAVPVLLFLYTSLLLGTMAIARYLFGEKHAQIATRVTLILLLAVLVVRNIQQSQVTFSVADLSAGATWVQANTSKDAVFMTPDPIPRYIHLRRHTVDYPENEETFWREVRESNVTHIMIAPPLRVDNQANVLQQPDHRVTDVILPIIAQSPDCFVAALQDPVGRVEVFQVAEPCRS